MSRVAASSTARWVVAGLFLGLFGVVGAVVIAPLVVRSPDEDVVEIRARASDEDRATWQAQYDARAKPWSEIPDPPGTGPVHVTRYWISHGIYDLEVRRRGMRIVVGIGGLDQQVMGGAWTAFGEGTLRVRSPEAAETASHPLAGMDAEIIWSCLGVTYRYASDGVGYLSFSDDGEEITARYMAYEDPTYWARAHGRVQRGPRPGYGRLRGQIALARYKHARFRLAAPTPIRVLVKSEDGRALSQVTVQPKGNDAQRVLTNDQGVALVTWGPKDFPIGPVVSAGVFGFRNGETVLPLHVLGQREAGPLHLEVTLAPMQTEDDPSYVWQRANPGHDADNAMACGTCHEWHYQEWIGSRHALSNNNGQVQWLQEGLRETSPEVAAECDGCHRPGHSAYADGAPFAPKSPLAANHCDVCHKIARVRDLRQSGMHGALEVVRPRPGSKQRPGNIHQVFGPRVDTTFAYMGAVQNPLFEASHLCAGCHQGGGAWQAGALPKMNTFEEWRLWAATRPRHEFRSCQDCHMPGGTTLDDDGSQVDQLAWDGAHRSPMALHSHRFEGTEPPFASEALDLQVTKAVRDGQLHVTVAVKNVGAGHHVPTGSWTKHVLVGVWARQGEAPLRLHAGPRARVVAEDPAEPLAGGDWRNPAGFILGIRPRKTIEGRFEPPSLRFAWKASDVHDTRLAPGASHEATFVFALSGTTPAQVEVRVVHRRGAFGAKLSDTPWPVASHDPMPQVLWKRVLR